MLFRSAAEDAHTALAFLRDTANVAKYRIDTANIVVAGHSMGGFMAADAAADDAKVAGLFLIDPWDIGATAAAIQTPDGLKWWKEEAQSDLPPLAGTSYDALTSEITGNAERFDLRSRVIAFGNRPMAVVGAERGIGEPVRAVAAAAQSVAPSTVVAIMPTDHSFSDKRIALADMLLRFLDRVAPPIH